jgi:alkylation response protein AidB-like acyl-CoA dehydrogenase
MSHYHSNVRDILFNLFEANDLAEHLGDGIYAEFDEDTVRHIVAEIDRLAREDFAASFVEADRVPLDLVDGEVKLHESMKKSLDAYYEGGWDLLSIPPELGGMGAPHQVRWAVQEMLVGANPALFFYISGSLMSVVIAAVGTEEQAEKWARPMIERHWGGTMVLTEPDAGSDVGAGTSRAVAVDEENGVYHLEGVKRFITSGEHDYAENIVHLVLARREGGEPGTPGLSMFIVPKYLVNDDGTLGERNGIVATNLEKKMGIRGSTTCELTMGADRPCVGYLVGGVHKGIKQMFEVIEDARLLIGAKSASTASAGYLAALEYAKERIQSADMTQMLDKSAPRVAIIRHPDVRRMLMEQKAYSEGLRALLFYSAWALDQTRLDPDDPYWVRLVDLLLPLLKGYASEQAYVKLGQSLQVLGGSGFLQDYPLEQYIRDVKIDSLYEGTTGIQALDLFFRKIARDQGATLGRLAEEVLRTVKGGSDEFEVERGLLGDALENAQSQLGVMGGHAMASMAGRPEDIYKTGLHANSLLESLAEIVIGWLLLRHAEVADAKLTDAGDDRAYYEGKIASARWFCHNVLPQAKLRRELAEREDGWLMALDDAAF